MTIWLLAILLLASLAGVGYRQGAIRVTFSLIGILIAALLAGPLSKVVLPALKALGVTNPVVLWALAPFVIFVIILAMFKVGALAAHKKIDVYYRYKAGDLRLALFERINARLGLCLGLVNGVVYLILLSFVIHAFSYWTLQLSSDAEDPRSVRILNKLGRDLHTTGMGRVARAIDPLKESYYASADLAGLLYQNPLLEARLTRYPGFTSLGLRQEFQLLGADPEFSNLRLQRKPLRQVFDHPTVATIVNNPDTLREIWTTLQPDLKDLSNFLYTAKSETYTEPILGRWLFDAGGTAMALRRDKPKLPATEFAKFRRFFASRFGRTTLIAAPNHQVVLKQVPQLKLQPGGPVGGDTQTLEGKWESAGGNYDLSLAGGVDHKTARLENGRLSIAIEGVTVVFERED